MPLNCRSIVGSNIKRK